jgi:hypothetical protein
VVFGLLAIWLLALMIVLRPQSHPLPTIERAPRLDRPNVYLPTLAPLVSPH